MHSTNTEETHFLTSKPSPKDLKHPKRGLRFRNSTPKSRPSQDWTQEVTELRSKVAELEKLLEWERQRGEQLMQQLLHQTALLEAKTSIESTDFLSRKQEESHRRVLSDLPSLDHVSKNMDQVTLLHAKVQSNLTAFQQKTTLALEEQGRDISKQMESKLRGRILDRENRVKAMEIEVKRAQESEKLAKKMYEDSKEQWVASEEQRRKYWKEKKELTDLNMENSRIIHDLQRQVLDLRTELSRAGQEPDRNQLNKTNPAPVHIRHLSFPRAQTQGKDTKDRSEYVISKLKRMLEAEKRTVRGIKNALATEVKETTELESFLKDCLADMRREIGKRKREEGLSEMERTEVLSALLSQAQVLRLLYDKTFPPKGATDYSRGGQTTKVDLSSSLLIGDVSDL